MLQRGMALARAGIANLNDFHLLGKYAPSLFQLAQLNWHHFVAVNYYCKHLSFNRLKLLCSVECVIGAQLVDPVVGI